jgi:hypothetical protein
MLPGAATDHRLILSQLSIMCVGRTRQQSTEQALREGEPTRHRRQLVMSAVGEQSQKFAPPHSITYSAATIFAAAVFCSS